MIIRIDNPELPHCTQLVEAHWDEMGLLYGDTGPCQYLPSDVMGDGCAFIVGWHEDRAVACGAIRPFESEIAESVAEVKRVYVRPEARNRGVARMIMDALESQALVMGYTRLTLETGTLQPFAIRLYERLGYQRIAVYGQWADDPHTVCMSKAIDVSSGLSPERWRHEPLEVILKYGYPCACRGCSPTGNLRDAGAR